jgi:hypothetical protein
MPNPYHDAAGRFCSANQMLTSINELAQAGEVEAFLQLRSEYEQIRRDIRFGRVESPQEYDTELKQFLQPIEAHPRYPLVDAKALPFSRVRRGVNAPGQVNQLLAQLDNEAREFQAALSKDDRFILSLYGGMGSAHVNEYLRDGEAGIRRYVARHDKPGTPLDEEEVETYLELAQKNTAQLDATFAAHERKETNVRVLHRSIRLPEGVDAQTFIDERYPVGAEVTESSYLSTSVDSDNVLLHTAGHEERTIVFEILSASGLPLHRTGEFGSHSSPGQYEREVLLNRNSRFKVLSHGEATYASTHTDGRPNDTFRGVKKRQRYTVVQLQEVA